MLSKNDSLLTLNNIARDKSNAPRHRLGRGFTRGHRCGRGSEGQKSRTGDANPKTEGGQFPVMLSQKKRGFASHYVRKVSAININSLIQYMKKQNINEMSLEDVCKFRKTNKKLSVFKIVGCTQPVHSDRKIVINAHKVSEKLQRLLKADNKSNITINIAKD